MGAQQDGALFPKRDEWPDVTDSRVRSSLRAVSRPAFVAPELRAYAGEDTPLPIGQGQTISQPHLVAIMLQALGVRPGEKVLEIGTGSGYVTALLCLLTAVEGQPLGSSVYSVERLPALAHTGAAALHGQGFYPHLRVGDGAAGWPQAAPFAAVIASAAAAHVPQPLYEQLAEGGRMVLPVGEDVEHQELWLLRKQAGKLQIERLGGVRFVPLISPLLDDPNHWVEVHEDAGFD